MSFLLSTIAVLALAADTRSPELTIQGQWELEREKTVQARKEVKELPAPMTIRPDPSAVLQRSITFRDSTQTISVGGNAITCSYSVERPTANSIVVSSRISGPSQPASYTRWRILDRDHIVSYLTVRSLDDALLTDETFPNFYRRVPSQN